MDKKLEEKISNFSYHTAKTILIVPFSLATVYSCQRAFSEFLDYNLVMTCINGFNALFSGIVTFGLVALTKEDVDYLE